MYPQAIEYGIMIPLVSYIHEGSLKKIMTFRMKKKDVTEIKKIQIYYKNISL